MFVYKITNNINGKTYIGQTAQEPKQRWKAHCHRGKPGIGVAIKKYGKENFTFDVLAKAFDMDELNWLEDKFIEKFGTMAPNGYNLREGGRNYKMTEEHKQKLRKINLGKKHTEEHKQKISKALRGRKMSEEEKRKHCKPIVCIETGVEFPSARECAKEMGLHHGHVSEVLNGKRKTHGGFTFRFKEEE